MLDKIKLLLGISPAELAKDELLELLIDMAKEEAVEYCHLEVYSSKLDTAVIKMVVQNYNRIGSEGVAAQSFSGVSESYVEGYAADIISLLNKSRKIRLL